MNCLNNIYKTDRRFFYAHKTSVTHPKHMFDRQNLIIIIMGDYIVICYMTGENPVS